MADINVRPNGPLIVTGEFKLLDGEGNAYTLENPERCVLCRCGGSANKPFCDGTHRNNGFASEVKAG